MTQTDQKRVVDDPDLAVHDPRPLDPNVLQRRASNPAQSVWVGASAGTGKTKVLVDRLLRLMLPNQNNPQGSAPHRILCLTFTKAGANEMKLRIGQVLGEWAVTPEDDLKKRLSDLCGASPDAALLKAARQLFAKVVDTAGGLKIMTIHGFCQSVLSRFPLESGLSPNFSVIDESEARDLLRQARDAVLMTRDEPIMESLTRLIACQNEDQFSDLLQNLSGERLQFETFLSDPDWKKLLFATLKVDSNKTEEDLIHAACHDSALDVTALTRTAKAFLQGSESNITFGAAVLAWLQQPAPERVETLSAWQALFLTQKGEPKKLNAVKKVKDIAPDGIEILTAEAQRLVDLDNSLRNLRSATLTCALFTVAQKILTLYKQKKNTRGALDYDDLILHTAHLLDNQGAPSWVMYKLDGGIDHVLVDEAQDTNPEQWHLIERLTDEFFSQNDANYRTLFVVGDEKQSIFSFQRAAPEKFAAMKALFAQKSRDAQKKWSEETLNISFRSTASVLKIVDEVFADPVARWGLGDDIPEHRSFRTATEGAAGLVELWSLVTPNDKDDVEAWSPPIAAKEDRAPHQRLADRIADTIHDWIKRGEILESQGRPIHAGDIMILVRTRSAFVAQMVRALKARSIPVSGVDRMVLNDQLAIMDFMAAAQFALLPDDDLTLACLLKSPLIGFSENELYDIAIDRNSTLWESLQKSSKRTIIDWLESIISRAASESPFSFFSRLLQEPCPADDVSGLRAMRKRLGEDCVDPLDEFLNAAALYERSHVASLQNFIVWQRQNDASIKRELEEAGRAVRIMTVHASKGLQAPIVFLPDTVRAGQSRKTPRLLFPDKTGLNVPLWSPRKDDEAPLYLEAKIELERRLDDEYRRLLYVAMTRAEERLYVCGARGTYDPLPDSWYNYIATAMERLPNVERIINDETNETVLRLTNPQTKPPKAKKAKNKDEGKIVPLPSWVIQPAPQEPVPPKPLIPSRPNEPDASVFSPLSAGESVSRFKRGTITHKLLQILPDLPIENRERAAMMYVSQPVHTLPENVQHDIVREVLDLLSSQTLAPLYGAGSMAEVPITGLVDGRIVSGQIDRLLVTDNEVLIIDYKTNRPSPVSEDDVPMLYRSQMQAYTRTLACIYPDKKIRSFLLWTDRLHLMEVKNTT